MKANSRLALSLRRLKNFTYRVLNRLQFLPFTLVYVLFNAALKLILLRLHLAVVRVGWATGDMTSRPRDAMLWLGRVLIRPPVYQFDLCLLLSREDADTELHNVFSVALSFSRVRSVCLYWDSQSLGDDLALLQSKRDRNDPAFAASQEEIGSRGSAQFIEFLHSDHGEFALPAAAAREAQTLLKRYMGATDVVCLNVPTELRALADAVAGACPRVRFFHFSPEPPELASAVNNQSFFGWGFTLHERMALVQAADAYVGTFDELGCTAVISGRPAILFGGSVGVPPDPISQSDVAVWFPRPLEHTALTEVVLQFLSRHLPLRAKVTAQIR